MVETSLREVLGIGRHSCVALIGGGGKTTLMLSLARELERARERPLVTTTTRIWPPPGMLLVLGISALREQPGGAGALCFGRRLSIEGKLEGEDSSLLCDLRASWPGPLLVEADGSAGRSLKLHASHEPVIPWCSTHVLIVAGLDAVGKPANDGVIHRAKLLRDALGSEEGEQVSPGMVARLLLRMESLVPAQAQPSIMLTKVDGEVARGTAADVMSHLTGSRSSVVLTSNGEVVGSRVGAVPLDVGRP